MGNPPLFVMDRMLISDLEVDRDETAWLLTRYMPDILLRLRIQNDESGDVDSAEHVTFEVKLNEAEMFVSLGDAILVAYLFTPECHDTIEMPCVCGWPPAYRSEFVQMVSQWGELRALSFFRSTVTGTPIDDVGRRHQQTHCPICDRHDDKDRQRGEVALNETQVDITRRSFPPRRKVDGNGLLECAEVRLLAPSADRSPLLSPPRGGLFSVPRGHVTTAS